MEENREKSQTKLNCSDQQLLHFILEIMCHWYPQLVSPIRNDDLGLKK